MASAFERPTSQPNNTPPAAAQSNPTLQSSWSESFRFSDDLAELERYQQIQAHQIRQMAQAKAAAAQQGHQKPSTLARDAARTADPTVAREFRPIEPPALPPGYVPQPIEINGVLQEKPLPFRKKEAAYTQHSAPEFLRDLSPSPDMPFPPRVNPARQPVREAVPFQADAGLIQANRILELEHQLAMVLATNEELRRDNRIMARQIQMLLDDREAAEEHYALLPPGEAARYQKIWGKLHLLL